MTQPRTYILWTAPREGRARVLDELVREIEALPDDAPWVVRIEQYEPLATKAEKDRFHAMVGQLADHTGDDPRSMKLIVKERIGLTDTVTRPGGAEVEVPRSINAYSGAQLRALCSRLEVLGAEYGCDLSGRRRSNDARTRSGNVPAHRQDRLSDQG